MSETFSNGVPKHFAFSSDPVDQAEAFYAAQEEKEGMKVQEGLVVFCDTLRWNDGWEFDCPSIMLSPVIRCFETGAHHEQIVEDVLIDAICAGEFISQSFEQTWGWRGYKLQSLQRRFHEALKGKKTKYTATREKIMFVKDADGELTWKTI